MRRRAGASRSRPRNAAVHDERCPREGLGTALALTAEQLQPLFSALTGLNADVPDEAVSLLRRSAPLLDQVDRLLLALVQEIRAAVPDVREILPTVQRLEPAVLDVDPTRRPARRRPHVQTGGTRDRRGDPDPKHVGCAPRGPRKPVTSA